MTRAKTASICPVAIATLLYLIPATVWAWSVGNAEFLLYIGVVFAIGLLIVAVHRRIGLSRGILWALSLWGLLHMLGGLLPVPRSLPVHGEQYVLYSLWLIPDLLKFDHLVHALGFGIATWVCWEGLQGLGVKKPTAGVLLLCVFAGMGLGAFNEIVEFIATILVPETNVGGYLNTGWDLVANTVGAVVAAGCIRFAYGSTSTKR